MTYENALILYLYYYFYENVSYMLWVFTQLMVFIHATYSLMLPLSYNNGIIKY